MTTATLLPLPRAVFYDPNGAPLAAGYVYTYVPGGTTPKTTWQDAGEATPNANPILLDANGSCLLYGSGNYQITVTDSLGNQVPAYSGLSADVVTETGISAAMLPVVEATTVGAAFNLIAANGGTVGGPLVTEGVVTVNAGLTAYQTAPVSTSPTGNPTTGSLLPTYSSVDVQTSTASSTNREFLVNIGLTSNLGAGVANNNGDKVALYVGAVGTAGTGDLWAMNPLLAQNAGSGTYNAQVIEVDMNNFNADKGGTDGSAGLPAQIANGISVSGINDSNLYCNTSGIAIDSFGYMATHPLWSRGLTMSGYYKFAGICDYSISPIAYEMWGDYTWGLNGANGSFSGSMILAPNNTNIITALTSGATDAVLLKMDGSNNVTVAASNVMGLFFNPSTAVAPLTDNAIPCGDSFNRWTAVWAVNGAIQTSDERLKTKNAEQRDFGAIIDALWVGDVTWNDGAQPPGLAVMAQQVAPSYPQAVMVPIDPEKDWGVNYASLGLLALKGVQDLRATVTELRAEIELLKSGKA